VRRFISLMVLASWLLSGCAETRNVGHDNVMQDVELENAARFVREKRYHEAVAIYSKIARESAGSRRGADALFAAATARVSADNPYKEYALALQEFDQFIQRYSDNEKVREARNWRSFIKTIIDLKKENEQLNGSIEQLKKIDIRHEERRRK
jgi:outer membrane protein assembly factor BamD (BamD/ComL family)